MVVKEPPFIGLFPHGQTRTGCSPRIDYFCIGPSALSDPFEEIENQSIDWIRHDRLLANVSRLIIVVRTPEPTLPTDDDKAFRRIGNDRIIDVASIPATAFRQHCHKTPNDSVDRAPSRGARREPNSEAVWRSGRTQGSAADGKARESSSALRMSLTSRRRSLGDLASLLMQGSVRRRTLECRFAQTRVQR
jgi:hypothetical protein